MLAAPQHIKKCPNCGRKITWHQIMADNGIDEPWLEGEMAFCNPCHLELWWHNKPKPPENGQKGP